MNRSAWRRKPARAEPSGGRIFPVVAGLMERLAFFRSFLGNPSTIGAVSPSSRVLARAMVEGCSMESAETVVELGPGTGAFTRLILDRIGPATTFFALELDPNHARILRRKFRGVQVYEDSAAKLIEYLGQHRKANVDYIVSGLPWANFPGRAQGQLLAAIQTALAPAGVFVTFAYAHACWLSQAKQFRRDLSARFGCVETSPIVWRNLPPAFVYRCRQSR
ncbi:MAG TPA: hypothetical protein VMN36_17765 [Verrucomicrobiales bacterium]|nr:hypothetical protein [Verrucomicrobiales bacterium]